MKRALRLACVAVLLTACGRSVVLESSTSGAGVGGTAGVGASSTTGFGGFGASSTGTGFGGFGASSTGSGFGGFGASSTGSGFTTTSTSSGFGGFGSTSSTGSSSGMICPGFGDPCTSCLSTACPATFCACTGNADCLTLMACFDNCNGAAACQQACQTAHPNGISDLYKLSGCAGTSCSSECPGNNPLDPCTECVIDTCPAALNTCLGDAECVALYQCLGACGNVDLVCQQGCYAQHGAGAAKLTALLQCETMPCGSTCK